MKKTMLSAVASLMAAGVLVGGCMVDSGGMVESEGVAAEGPTVGGSEEVGEAQQALAIGGRFNSITEAGLPTGPRAELQIWRTSSNLWAAQRTYDAYNQSWSLNRTPAAEDVPVMGNFDGDSVADAATWRPSSGMWIIRRSSDGVQYTQQWGAPGDIPTPGDFDGDGKTDVSVWRPSSGTFYVINSSNGAGYGQQWGTAGDIPVVGDYDGDGKDDKAVWTPSSGMWSYIRSSNGVGQQIQWGASGDIPSVGDYDGDGKVDVTVYRPSNVTWYTIKSTTGAGTATAFGDPCDIPQAGDYDGDGKTDIALRRMSNATFYYINSSTGAGVGTAYGWTTDVPANASTNCYISGVLGPCRSAACGPVGGVSSTLQNTSFESTAISGSNAQVNAGDSTTITGWTVEAGNVDLARDVPIMDGQQAIDLNGNGPGQVYQYVSIPAGKACTLTFGMSANVAGSPTNKTMNVSATNGSTQSYSHSGNGYGTGSYTFTAGSAVTKITFASTTSASPYGPVIDNLSLACN